MEAVLDGVRAAGHRPDPAAGLAAPRPAPEASGALPPGGPH